VIFSRLESRVCLDEGFSPDPYLDIEKVPTIGYGTTRILGRPVTMNDPPIREPVARHLLRADLFVACLDAQDLFSTFGEMNAVRREVLANMAYNLGRNRLSGFHRFIEAADRLDYEAMAAEMKDSKWYRQTKTRAMRLHQAMLTGEW
jgi:lysozyme